MRTQRSMVHTMHHYKSSARNPMIDDTIDAGTLAAIMASQ